MSAEGGSEKADCGKKVNGTDQGTGIVQPTYRKLQDADSNWKPKSEQIEMSKQNGTDADVDDGAQEKMLKEDSKPVVTPAKNNTEQVKFGSSNGETKIDIEIAKPTLSGMGIEELMKFANDPFWVRLRWLLFVSFWILWFGMLAGAITIIVLAPKCVPPEPKKFWEKSIIMSLDADEFKADKLEPKFIEDLKKLNIATISLPPIYAETAPGEVTNFTDINTNFLTMNSFMKFMNTTKESEVFVVLELNPHVTGLKHDWFNKSVYGEEKYKDFYIWRNASGESDGKPQPPVKQLIDDDKTADKNGFMWEWNDVRKQFYLHNFNKLQPSLNFRNPMVVEEFKKVMEHWINLGVSGFRLTGGQYLIKDLQADEKFHDLNEKNIALIKELHTNVLNKTDRQGLLAFKEPIGNDVVKLYKAKNAVDLAYTTQIIKTVSYQSLKVKEFGESIQTLLENDSEWPSWDLRRFATKMEPEESENIMLFTMLLPGTPIVYPNDINNNIRHTFVELSKARNVPTFQYGNYTVTLLHNDTVIAYTRIKSGSPGFLVAYNSNQNATVVDFSSLKYMPEELLILANPPNYGRNETVVESKWLSKTVLLQPRSTLAMKFVPEME